MIVTTEGPADVFRQQPTAPNCSRMQSSPAMPAGGVVLAPVVLNLHDPVVHAGHRVENRTIGTPAAFVPTRTGASGVTVHPFRVAASAGVETRTSGRTTAAAAAPAMPNLRILASVLVDIGVLLR
jgi:hypothetical protein